MQTIKNDVSNILIIKNSKFICYLFKVNNLNDINNYLNLLKNEYNKATHYCYAYIINDLIKFSDDGEPSGTAGVPIKEVLLKTNLNNILCVVIRYFGGIKLGAGGLIRAYNKCVCECIKKANLIKLEKGKRITFTFNYEQIKEIDYLIKDCEIVNKLYDDIIEYTINSCNANIIDKLYNNKNIKILEEKDILLEIN